MQLLSELKPHIYVKGSDYDMRTLTETKLVEGYGGQAVAIPFVDGYSTSELPLLVTGRRAVSLGRGFRASSR